jgi:hypothetical protein
MPFSEQRAPITPEEHESDIEREDAIGDYRFIIPKEGEMQIFYKNEEIHLASMSTNERVDYWQDLLGELIDSAEDDIEIREDGTASFLYVNNEPRAYIKAQEGIEHIPEPTSGLSVSYIETDASPVKNSSVILLLSKLLNHKDVEFISGDLVEDNAVDDLNEADRDIIHALRKTPAYRYRAMCGFTQIDGSYSSIYELVDVHFISLPG